MYGTVLGAAFTVPATLVLPNTGNNHALAVTALVSIVVGVSIMVTSIVRMVAKKVHQA